jgi:hypothetical protein
MFVLKSYVHCAPTFGDISRAFRSALSSVVSLYSAASIHPEIFEAILLRLLSAKGEFAVASFRLVRVMFQVLEVHFILV